MSRIQQAQEYLNNEVFAPPLAAPDFPELYKAKIKNSQKWVQQFKRVGDLIRYLERFWDIPHDENQDSMYTQLTTHGLRTFEEIKEDFLNLFGGQIDDCTTLDHFIIGNVYTSWDLAIFARVYDNQQGILMIGPEEQRDAIFIKATLDEGAYQNEWLVPGEVLKYYLKGITNNKLGKKIFKESYKHNAAIINSGDTPIYVYEKQGSKRVLVGIFEYVTHNKESDGSMWFRLQRRQIFTHSASFSENQYRVELSKRITESRKSTSTERQERLKTAQAKPKSRTATVVVHDRNPDVIAEVLERANGVCEWCKQPAPFIRRSNQTPYLEVHHVQLLAEDGADTVENARALCANCHRKAHYGEIPNSFLHTTVTS